MSDQIRAIMSELPKLAAIALTVADDADLWDAGMDSITSVQVLLGLEEHFGVELPDESLTRDTFRSIRAMREVLEAQGVPAP